MPNEKQRRVLGNIAAAFATLAIATVLAVSIPPLSAVRAIPLHYVWAYAMALELIWLPLLIGVRAHQRYRNDDQIDGQPPPADSVGAIDARVLQNTLEQTVFAVIATGLLALSQAHGAAMLLVAHALLFTVGRATFWYGYRKHPNARGYGFVLSFCSSLGLYFYAVSFLLRALILN